MPAIFAFFHVFRDEIYPNGCAARRNGFQYPGRKWRTPRIGGFDLPHCPCGPTSRLTFPCLCRLLGRRETNGFRTFLFRISIQKAAELGAGDGRTAWYTSGKSHTGAPVPKMLSGRVEAPCKAISRLTG